MAVDGARALLPLVEGQLGPDAAQLRDALSQLQMAYVQLGGKAGGGAAPPPAARAVAAGGPGGGPAGRAVRPGGPHPGPPALAEAAAQRPHLACRASSGRRGRGGDPPPWSICLARVNRWRLVRPARPS